MNRSVSSIVRDRPPVLVVAGLIERDGLVLIGQRRSHEWNGLRWEFPGGKVEHGEPPAEALARELMEELGIRALIGGEITRYEHQYPGRPVMQLIFYQVSEFDGEPENRAFQQIRWEQPGRLADYDFLDGDLDFIRRLASGEFSGPLPPAAADEPPRSARG